MRPIIEVNHISKKYRIGEKQRYYSFRDTLTDFAKLPFRKKAKREEFWALKDVSFKVMPGEVLGIIGRNGAGKSTLLKILSRITPPTKGEITLRGRVASLLEVGTGFNHELTGRENIYLNGTILGMRRTEINDKFDEIVEFAEISKFLDTPVKFYSSGMYMRLAFAVAAHLDPEILLVDEVLAVGDAQFQKKCLGKMSEVSRQGRTVMFVSHNMISLSQICDKGILLDHGTIRYMGSIGNTINKYSRSKKTQPLYINNSKPTKPIEFQKIRLTGVDKITRNAFSFFEDINIEIIYFIQSDISGAVVNFMISKDGNPVLLSFDIDENMRLMDLRRSGIYKVYITIPSKFFKPGQYDISFKTGYVNGAIFDEITEKINFEITTDKVNQYSSFDPKRPGQIGFPLLWHQENYE